MGVIDTNMILPGSLALAGAGALAIAALADRMEKGLRAALAIAGAPLAAVSLYWIAAAAG